MYQAKIIPIWQPLGSSTHVIAKVLAEKHGVKTSHTGTLDPMAEGVIIVLVDDERHKKYDYAYWLKTYTFEIAFGIKIDTYDGLGIVDEVDLDNSKLHDLSADNLNIKLQNFVGNYSQTIPPFSAIKIKGKPAHWYARNNKLHTITLPKRHGDIKNIQLISLKTLSIGEIVDDLVSKINFVEGDLRQTEIIKKWLEIKGRYSDKFLPVAKINVQTTKGLYIRSFSQDIANSLGVLGFVLSLVRDKNGMYGKENSLTLHEAYSLSTT